MTRKGITRQQPLTDEEAARYQRVREQIAAELPDIRRRAKRPNRAFCSSMSSGIFARSVSDWDLASRT